MLTWPSSKKKWTQHPKQGWNKEAMDYFDAMVKMEDEDRKKYDKDIGKNIDVSDKVDVYKYDEYVDIEEGCIVDVDDVIDV